jgi:phospholipase D1/2
LGRLRRAGINPDDFLVFLSLRTHGIIDGIKKQPVTEIVYLHSKLMIIDDKRVIIGSANINDRSMRGSRDSELCFLV